EQRDLDRAVREDVFDFEVAVHVVGELDQNRFIGASTDYQHLSFLEGIERKACVDGASCAAEHAALTGRLPRACRIVERDVRAAQQPQGGQYLLAAGLDARTVARVLGLHSFGQVEQALPASAERLRRRGRSGRGEVPPLALERIERLDETHLFRSGIV